ncbi:MAG: hypothetical protein V1728_03980 [Candidatus Micrarchaeota archaeon]
MANERKPQIDVVPAILVHSLDELRSRIASVPGCRILQIDLMDGKFVSNKTIGLVELEPFVFPAPALIEYHLMVADPLEWIKRLPAENETIFQVHVESLKSGDFMRVREAVKARGAHCSLAWALNPPTPLSAIEAHLDGISEVLVMTVNPGFSGQKYISEMEGKMRALRAAHPGLIIEIDGGVDQSNASGAVRAGANRLAAASALFKQKDPQAACQELKRLANSI